MRDLVSAIVALALCALPARPAIAQDHRFAEPGRAQGATATVNFRVPLGARGRDGAPSYGLTLSYDQATGPASPLAVRPEIRSAIIADPRFSGGVLRDAHLGAFNLADPDQRRRMNLSEGKAAWTIWLIAALALGATLCFLECSSNEENRQPPYTPPP